MRIEQVALSAIDFECETYRVSEDLDSNQMCASLQAVGLMHPVVLLDGHDYPSLAIVCGFRRLHGLRAIGILEAAATILRSEGLTPLEVFLRAVWDNLSHRQLNPLETARVLTTLAYTCGVSSDTLVDRYLPLLGLRAHRNVLRAYLHLHRLNPELRRSLNAGHLTLASADRLARATPEEQAAAASLFSKIRLSASLQRAVLEFADDLAAITKSSIAEVLNQPEITTIVGDVRLSAFQKGEKIHDCLYRRRNPRITQARQRFLSERARLNLPGTIRIATDPFFETPRLRVEFDVTSAQEYRQAIESLDRAGRTSSLERLFEIV